MTKFIFIICIFLLIILVGAATWNYSQSRLEPALCYGIITIAMALCMTWLVCDSVQD